MGADLYRKNWDAFEEAGKSYSDPLWYYRDSYNDTAVLFQLDMSWWRDVTPLLDEEQLLQPDKARVLIEMIEQRPVPETTAERLKYAELDDDGENSLAGWHSYFVEKRERLLAFLRTAADAGDTIYCSL